MSVVTRTSQPLNLDLIIAQGECAQQIKDVESDWSDLCKIYLGRRISVFDSTEHSSTRCYGDIDQLRNRIDQIREKILSKASPYGETEDRTSLGLLHHITSLQEATGELYDLAHVLEQDEKICQDLVQFSSDIGRCRSLLTESGSIGSIPTTDAFCNLALQSIQLANKNLTMEDRSQRQFRKLQSEYDTLESEFRDLMGRVATDSDKVSPQLKRLPVHFREAYKTYAAHPNNIREKLDDSGNSSDVTIPVMRRDTLLERKRGIGLAISMLPEYVSNRIYSYVGFMNSSGNRGLAWGKQNVINDLSVTECAINRAIQEMDPTDRSIQDLTAILHEIFDLKYNFEIRGIADKILAEVKLLPRTEQAALLEHARKIFGYSDHFNPDLEDLVASELNITVSAYRRIVLEKVFGNSYIADAVFDVMLSFEHLVPSYHTTLQALRNEFNIYDNSDAKGAFDATYQEMHQQIGKLQNPNLLHIIRTYSPQDVYDQLKAEIGLQLRSCVDDSGLTESLSALECTVTKAQYLARIVQIQNAIETAVEALPFKEEVYREVYELTPTTSGEVRGWGWGKANLTKNLLIAMEAFQRALDKKMGCADDTEGEAAAAHYASTKMPLVESGSTLSILRELKNSIEQIQADHDDATAKVIIKHQLPSFIEKMKARDADSATRSLFGYIWEMSEDSSRFSAGDPNWAQNHATENLPLLVAAIENAIANTTGEAAAAAHYTSAAMPLAESRSTLSILEELKASIAQMQSDHDDATAKVMIKHQLPSFIEKMKARDADSAITNLFGYIWEMSEDSSRFSAGDPNWAQNHATENLPLLFAAIENAIANLVYDQ